MKLIILAQPVTAFVAMVVEDVVDAEPKQTVTFWSSELSVAVRNLLDDYPMINQIVLYGMPNFTDHFVNILHKFGLPVVQFDPSKDV